MPKRKNPGIEKYDTSQTISIVAGNAHTLAFADLIQGLKNYNVWMNYALYDIRQRFRRSTFGPFWLTISTGLMIVSIGYIFSKVFRQDMFVFIPRLATGLIFWNFLRMVVDESGKTFTDQVSFIRDVPAPLSIHFYRIFTRSFIVWLHDMVVFVPVYLIFPRPISIEYLLFIPGLLLFLMNLFFGGLIIAVLSTRFRDIPLVIANLMQIVFLITPIIWNIEIMEAKGRMAIVNWNPFYHVLEIVRAPLLGMSPDVLSWYFAGSMALVSFFIAIILFRRAYAKIPFWI